jgi:hypothetical protein
LTASSSTSSAAAGARRNSATEDARVTISTPVAAMTASSQGYPSGSARTSEAPLLARSETLEDPCHAAR